MRRRSISDPMRAAAILRPHREGKEAEGELGAKSQRGYRRASGKDVSGAACKGTRRAEVGNATIREDAQSDSLRPGQGADSFRFPPRLPRVRGAVSARRRRDSQTPRRFRPGASASRPAWWSRATSSTRCAACWISMWTTMSSANIWSCIFTGELLPESMLDRLAPQLSPGAGVQYQRAAFRDAERFLSPPAAPLRSPRALPRSARHEAAAEIFQAALDFAGCPPEQCFYTDDIADYVAAARRMGIDGVVFESRGQLEGELRQRGISWE